MNHVLSPAQIVALFTVYVGGEDAQEISLATKRDLLNMQLIRQGEGSPSLVVIGCTPLGEAHVLQLMQTPLPRQVYVDQQGCELK